MGNENQVEFNLKPCTKKLPPTHSHTHTHTIQLLLLSLSLTDSQINVNCRLVTCISCLKASDHTPYKGCKVESGVILRLCLFTVSSEISQKEDDRGMLSISPGFLIRFRSCVPSLTVKLLNCVVMPKRITGSIIALYR